MSASAVFASELEQLGVWWPEGDGDALRVSADAWLATADLLDDIGRVLDTAAAMVTENYHGEASGRFAALWSRWSGERGYVAVTAADCRRIATALTDFAGDIDTADRALLHLIDEALDSTLAPTLASLDELWQAWLTDGADAIGAGLGRRADAAADQLAQAGAGTPILSPDERAAIDPARVTWPDLGAPVDLGHLATTPVDLGAGQGELPTVTVAPVPVPDDVGDPSLPPVTTPGTGAAGGVTVIINGDGNTVTIEAPATPAIPPFEYEPPPDAFDPFATDDGPTDPFATELAEPLPIDDPAFDFQDGLDPISSPSPFDTFETFDTPVAPTVASAPARLGEIDTIDTQSPIAIRVDPPGPGALAAGTAGAAAAAAGAAAKSGRAPFFPFMPMGGGMTGGDESPEPRRRSVRKRPHP